MLEKLYYIECDISIILVRSAENLRIFSHFSFYVKSEPILVYVFVIFLFFVNSKQPTPF